MYQMNEGTIDLPAAWKDQSINVISSGGNVPLWNTSTPKLKRRQKHCMNSKCLQKRR